MVAKKVLSLSIGLLLLGVLRAQAPSVVLIVADDLGWGDLSIYGSRSTSTPHLDRLAHQGAYFTDFYSVSPVCSPSRAALLTGRYPPRTGVTGVVHPNSSDGLPVAETTLAEVLRQAGYVTTAVGKWHLGDSSRFLPTRHGFDEYFGIPYSHDMIPLRYVRGEEVLDEIPSQAYLTRRFTEVAIEMIRRHAANPFFLYLAYSAPHTPLELPTRWKGRSGAGLYADTIEYLDHQIGRLLEELERLGLAGRTLVIFTSDNGSWRLQNNGGLRGGKKSVYEGGVRVPLIVRYPPLIDQGQRVGLPAMMCDLLPTVAGLAGAGSFLKSRLDGRDLSGALGASAVTTLWPARDREDPIFLFKNGLPAAVRQGDWKLVVAPRSPYFRGRDQLYNLSHDQRETRNMVSDHPGIAARLGWLIESFDHNAMVASSFPEQGTEEAGERRAIDLPAGDSVRTTPAKIPGMRR